MVLQQGWTRERSVRTLPLSVALMSTLLGGCVATSLERSMTLAGLPAQPEGFETARREPLSAHAHIQTSLDLLARGARTRADIELAKSGFQTAARLAPDLWEPMVGLAAAHYRLGEYRQALEAFTEAVERRGTLGDFALPYALVAYRAQQPELARLAFAEAAGVGGEGAQFLSRAFTGETAWRPRPVEIKAAPEPADAERNILIEAFLIRDTRNAVLNQGLNLLDSLALQFEGTLVNYSYDGDGNEQSGDISVTLPGITYSLNVAGRDLSHVSVEGSPVVIAREGKTSKFLEGGSVLIVPLADDSNAVERDVGISLEVTPERIGPDDVDLNVALELSNITGQSLSSVGQGASVLQTDKTRVEASARVPFRKAMLVGSTGSLSRRDTGDHTLTPVPIPGLSAKGASAVRRDVLALISVRRAEDSDTQPLDAGDVAERLFGTALPAPGAYGERPSDTPEPGLELLLARSRN